MRKHPQTEHGPASAPQTTGKPTLHPQDIDNTTPSRGNSIQGDRQSAKGGPAGANQGGAPRGGSRIEPSHQQRAARSDRAKK